MLTKSGAKLVDFGIARMRAALGMQSESSGQTATARATLTAEGTLLGTLHYMSRFSALC
jgi:serine/threonine protein kinase